MFVIRDNKNTAQRYAQKISPEIRGLLIAYEQIILEGKPFESYKDELKSQCKAEGVDYENLVYDLEDFIEELSIGLGSSDGLAAAMGIGFALMDAEKFYIRREKIEEIYDIWDQRYPNRVIHLHNPIELGTNDNNS